MDKVKIAVIPAAGLGTRFLPITKSIPKEMLPLVDKPIILLNINEAVKSGIENVVLITNDRKKSISDFFAPSPTLEAHLEKNKEIELLKQINSIKNMCNIISVNQEHPLGLGNAILCAQPIVGDQAFAVILGDEIFVNDALPATGQLIRVATSTKKSAVSVSLVPREDLHKYGIASGEEQEEKDVFEIQNLVEKPRAEDALSRFALSGRYVFEPKIFEYLEKTRASSGEKDNLTKSMAILAKEKEILAVKVKGTRYDTGSKLGYLQANIEFGLKHDELKSELKKYLINLVRSF